MSPKTKQAELVNPYTKGDKVKVTGERGGSYVVYRSELSPDGSILLYGGDANPNGVRGFRSVMLDRVVPEVSKAKKRRKGSEEV